MKSGAPQRLGLVGRGRAARTLEPRLARAGLAPTWWWSRGDAADAASLPGVDLVLLAVPDAAIADAARALAARPSAPSETWLHLAGSQPAALARVDATRPQAAGLFHPLAALPGAGAAPDLLVGATCGLAGDRGAVDAGRSLAAALGMRPLTLDAATQPLYHAAGVTMAGHLTALASQALTMLAAAGMAPDDARRALLGLARGALANLEASPPEDAITGPITRGDVATIREHLARLDALDAHLAATYRRLGLTALELSRPRLPAATAASLEALLRP